MTDLTNYSFEFNEFSIKNFITASIYQENELINEFLSSLQNLFFMEAANIFSPQITDSILGFLLIFSNLPVISLTILYKK